MNGVILGLVGGGAFATLLSIAERHRTLDQLSLRRVAVWGGIGGMALLLLFTPAVLGSGRPLAEVFTSYLTQLSIMGVLGSGFASGSVALARKGDAALLPEMEPDLLQVEEG